MRIKNNGTKISLKDDLHNTIWDYFDIYLESYPEATDTLNQFFDSKTSKELMDELVSVIESHLAVVTE